MMMRNYSNGSAKRMLKSRKGFTLVELIVVLVILAILAAILVPQLLGWIDRAKINQDIFNARNCVTATQAQLTKQYAFAREGQKAGVNGKDKQDQKRSTIVEGKYGVNDNGDVDVVGTQFAEDLLAMADEKPYILIVGLGRREKYEDTDLKKAFTIYVAMYMRTKDSKPLFFDGEQWTTLYLEKDAKKPGCVFKAGNELISNGIFIQYYVIANGSKKTVTNNQIWQFLRDQCNK